MINSELLKEKIKNSQNNIKDIATQLNLTYREMLKKINGTKEFKVSEIAYISTLLKLTIAEKESIFFNSNSRLKIYK